jgi:ankyrin repeat protein
VAERNQGDGFAAAVAAALHAVADGDVERVRQLLDEAPGIVAADGPHPYWGGRPRALEVAAEWGHVDVARVLLDAGADPNADASSYGGWTPLLLAASKRRNDVVQLLLDNQAAIGIFEACVMGDEARVAQILEQNPAAARRTGPSAATPLHFAATPAIADRLLQLGADPLARDIWGNTPVRSAAASPLRREVAGFLLEYSGPDDIFLACALGSAGRVNELLDRDPALLTATTFQHDALGGGGTPLHVAAAQGQTGIVQLLLQRGADPNVRGMGGVTPLHFAAAGGHIEAARVLLEAGADRHARDSQHDGTPLDWAEFQRKPEMIRFLQQTD